MRKKIFGIVVLAAIMTTGLYAQGSPLLAGTFVRVDAEGRNTISFTGNTFNARIRGSIFTGTVVVSGNTFTLIGHNSGELIGTWEIPQEDVWFFGDELIDGLGEWWWRYSDTVIQPLNLAQAHGQFIEVVGQMNAHLFPQHRFTWNNTTEILSFTSRTFAFTGTDLGFTHSPISFQKEMEVRFQGREIVDARWRYMYISADPWFQVGNPSSGSPIGSRWFNTAVPNNGIVGTGSIGVINTIVHFESLRVNGRYTFRRGGGANTTLTVRQ